MNNWEQNELKRRWEIIKGQTLNLVWQEILTDTKQNHDEKLKTLKLKFPETLKVVTELLMEGGDMPSSVSGGGKNE